MLIRTLLVIRVIQILTNPVLTTETTVKTTNTEITQTSTDTIDDFGIYGADSHAETVIADAIDRFAEAGLPLPDLRIYVHTDDAGCGGHQGLYRQSGDPHRIDLCDLDATIHELAHAWEHHHLTDATRQEFMNNHNIATWNDPNQAHAHRGIEQVAFAITWGLADEPVQTMLTDHYADELARYQLLTGTTTPRLTDTHTPITLDIDITPTANPTFG